MESSRSIYSKLQSIEKAIASSNDNRLSTNDMTEYGNTNGITNSAHQVFCKDTLMAAANEVESVSYTHLTLPTNREV